MLRPWRNRARHSKAPASFPYREDERWIKSGFALIILSVSFSHVMHGRRHCKEETLSFLFPQPINMLNFDLAYAFNMAPTPKLESHMKLMISPTRRRLSDISNTPPTPSAKRVKLFTESLPLINVIIVLTF
jgi:hypothetical protein